MHILACKDPSSKNMAERKARVAYLLELITSTETCEFIGSCSQDPMNLHVCVRDSFLALQHLHTLWYESCHGHAHACGCHSHGQTGAQQQKILMPISTWHVCSCAVIAPRFVLRYTPRQRDFFQALKMLCDFIHRLSMQLCWKYAHRLADAVSNDACLQDRPWSSDMFFALLRA